MMVLIKDELRSIIEENEWMDEETKKHGVKKLNKMRINVAFPDELFDDKLLEEYYKDVRNHKLTCLSFLF